jgi:Flp pilus assembly protein TadG
MVKKIVIAAVVVVMVVAVINDIGRYIITWNSLDQATIEAARIASQTKGRDAAAQAAVDYAATQGVTVYAYDERGGDIYIWTETPLEGAWFLDSVLLVVQGGSLNEPYVVRTERVRPKT